MLDFRKIKKKKKKGMRKKYVRLQKDLKKKKKKKGNGEICLRGLTKSFQGFFKLIQSFFTCGRTFGLKLPNSLWCYLFIRFQCLFLSGQRIHFVARLS